MSGELNLPQVTANQSNKEATINQMGATLEAAIIQRIPAGGKKGQILAKASDADYDVQWIDAPTGGSGGSGGTGGGSTGPDYTIARKAWRLNISSTDAGDGPVAISELQLATTANGPNIVTGHIGTAFADQAESSHTAAMAFDGSTSAYWSSLGGNTSTTTHIIGVILSTSYAVRSVTVGNVGGDGYWKLRSPKNFTIEFSDDTTTGLDGTWTVAKTVTQTTAWMPNETRQFTF